MSHFWHKLKFSDVNLRTRLGYSLDAEKDVKKANKQTKKHCFKSLWRSLSPIPCILPQLLSCLRRLFPLLSALGILHTLSWRSIHFRCLQLYKFSHFFSIFCTQCLPHWIFGCERRARNPYIVLYNDKIVLHRFNHCFYIVIRMFSIDLTIVSI